MFVLVMIFFLRLGYRKHSGTAMRTIKLCVFGNVGAFHSTICIIPNHVQTVFATPIDLNVLSFYMHNETMTFEIAKYISPPTI